MSTPDTNPTELPNEDINAPATSNAPTAKPVGVSQPTCEFRREATPRTTNSAVAGKFTQLLKGTDAAKFKQAWDSTTPAAEFEPMPVGEYIADVTNGQLKASRSHQTPGYAIEFTIVDGDFRGRKLWLDCWLTERAMQYAKRDLAKIGISSPEQMDLPVPPGIRCRLVVVLKKNDDGVEHNRVRSFEVMSVTPPKADPFAPPGIGQPSSGGAPT